MMRNHVSSQIRYTPEIMENPDSRDKKIPVLQNIRDNKRTFYN